MSGSTPVEPLELAMNALGASVDFDAYIVFRPLFSQGNLPKKALT